MNVSANRGPQPKSINDAKTAVFLEAQPPLSQAQQEKAPAATPHVFSSLLDRAEGVLERIASAFAVFGGLVLVAIMGIVCANIGMRLWGGNLRGTVEISGVLCALAVGLCLPAAQVRGSHIEVGVWVKTLSPLARRLQKAGVNLVCALLLTLAATELWQVAAYTRDMDEVIEGFPFSSFFMTVGLALGVALHGLLFLAGFCRAFFPRPNNENSTLSGC